MLRGTNGAASGEIMVELSRWVVLVVVKEMELSIAAATGVEVAS